ncbi:hypothetical protein, variant [Verruconis gallopava]|uniref:F-box domain-containing protein n=1 Tax=Verruconis gallopava TaxID=253628 RepID=A0A0D2ANE9_9PEZI|nr:hypothetical protein, variant [Verruconis gallopava]KIW08258.1 hypothetical protein, variant [Verruconis gallopava]
MAVAGSFGECTRPPGGNVMQPHIDLSMAGTSQLTHPSKMPLTLLDLLSNSIIMRQTAPYIPVSSLYALSRASKSFRQVVACSPEATRYLDLSTIKVATFDISPIDSGGISWRSQRMDEALTEVDFYSGPLRGIMSRLLRQNVLGNVATMILDGLTVPAEFVGEIISEDKYNIRILSIREAKHLNERKLMQVLNYAVRPTRPPGTPKLKGLYVFGPMEARPGPLEPEIGRRRSPTRYPDSSPAGVMNALGAKLGAEWNKKSQEALNNELCGIEDRWYQKSGSMFKKTPLSDWATTLKACEGIIHFDAVLCRGPRHDPNNFTNQDPNSPPNPHNTFLLPAVATIALGPHGCSKCKSSPEGPAIFGKSPSYHLPLLAPPPMHSSSIRAAQWPHTKDSTAEPPRLFVRCKECLKHRWCERCGKWWDEACYMPLNTRTELQNQEFMQWQVLSTEERPKEDIKVHMGLCVDHCLVGEHYAWSWRWRYVGMS